MGTLSRWVFFNIFVLVAVALDLGVFHRRPHKIGLRESAIWKRLEVTPTLSEGPSIKKALGLSA